jgi:truncated hemoglobin YjbI
MPEDGETPTLYQWAGGEDAIRRMINAFYDRVERDELISPFFPDGVGAEHRDHVVAWWSGSSAGPTGTHGSSADMSGCSPGTAAWGSTPSSAAASSH